MTFPALRTHLPQTWTDFARFVRRPELLRPIGLRAGWRTWLSMLSLDIAVLLLLIPLLAGWQKISGTHNPEAFEQFPQQWLLPAAVLAAPVLEELAFRGWLSGRPRALWLLGVAAAFIAVFAGLHRQPLTSAGLLLAAAVAALGGWLMLRRRPAAVWFERRFALPFYGSAILFGLVHVLNYGQPELKVVPLVAPQLWSGLTLGYTRMKVGLPASMLLHASANALALGLVAAGF